MDRRTVTKRIGDHPPSGKDKGHPVYLLKEIAPLLFSNQGAEEFNDPDQMHPSDRDKWFSSEQRRQKLEEDARKLIPDYEVAAAISGTLKTLQQNIIAFPDTTEKDLDLTPEQCKKMIRWSDGLLKALKIKLHEFITNEL